MSVGFESEGKGLEGDLSSETIPTFVRAFIAMKMRLVRENVRECLTPVEFSVSLPSQSL